MGYKGKSMMCLFYILQLVKRHISERSDVEQRKIKPVALFIAKLCLAEGSELS